jgi:hypothetical protein
VGERHQKSGGESVPPSPSLTVTETVVVVSPGTSSKSTSVPSVSTVDPALAVDPPAQS